MAHTGIFATSDEILVKAGENYDTSITEARINALCLQSESLINAMTRNNFSDSFSGLNVDAKAILSEISSNLVAIYIITYHMDSYSSMRAAEGMVNILRDGALRGISVLRDKKTQTWMLGA